MRAAAGAGNGNPPVGTHRLSTIRPSSVRPPPPTHRRGIPSQIGPDRLKLSQKCVLWVQLIDEAEGFTWQNRISG
jgi:hypothetical protein